MDKQMIEEMAGCKDCYDNLGHCPSQDNKEICPCYKNAVENYKQGYRKIPENAVVLTREEFEVYEFVKKKHASNEEVRSSEIVQGILHHIKTVRKETAEKFAKKVHNLFNRDIKDSVVYTQEEKDILKDFVDSIDEICKEITEGKDDKCC